MTDLVALATQINAAHEEAQTYASKAVERALVAGDLLLKAKAQCQHGQWLPWLRAHCPAISTRTIQNYMRVARELPAEKRTDAYLSLNEVLRLVAGPATDAEPTSEVEPVSAEEQALFKRLERGIEQDIDRTALFMEQLKDVLHEARQILTRCPRKFQEWCEKKLKLDSEMLIYIETPPSPWNQPTSAMRAAQIRWMLVNQGMDDEAREFMRWWQQEDESADPVVRAQP